MTGEAQGSDDGMDEALALVGRPRATRTTRTPRPESAQPDAAPGAWAPDPQAPPAHRHGVAWPEARSAAARAGATAARTRRPAPVPLGQALGRVLAEPLRALTDLPSFDTSAMDGWAVAGPGPWRTLPEGSVLAGHAPTAELADGHAVRIATGARVPTGATAVVRAEHSRTDATGQLHARREVGQGQDIRPRGQECRAGDRLMSAGTAVTPAVLGLAAAAGYDELTTYPRPRVEVLVLGDELLTSGLPHDGLIRDALGPLLDPWLRALGADVLGIRRIGDDAEELYEAVTGSAADVVVTTGGTASGPVDHVHPVLAKAGATLLVDGVRVRPGHPMLLAALGEPGSRYLVGLPGNPLAAVSGLLTLAAPLLSTLAGCPAPGPASAQTSAAAPASIPAATRDPYAYAYSYPTPAPNPASDPDTVSCRVPVRDGIQGHPHDTRLVPVLVRDGEAVPLRYSGPAMLRGVAAADAMAVVPPGGARPGQPLDVLDLPWTAPTAGQGVCFT
ncbi:molybdopterin molybdotransferase MoeA [Streptomyces sp. NPDC046203]|uniref:molybdopterin molybdotransferase MoeA n=1 Tax=Streptomyces sp. NPDC046203 TaxID=3154602 RepID=UPI00340E77AF